jgi:two-component system response regulator AtoC
MTDFRAESIILGEAAPIRELRRMIHRVANGTTPVLIQGPTGSGKELVAEAIHRLSGRTGDLVAVNVCAIGDGMMEDALFGHKRGAFTGATNDHVGLLAEAHNGTLFLDEIASMSGVVQAKLLRVIETQKYRIIGTSIDRHSDFRLVAASNVPLDGLVKRGGFRGDLMWRLRGLVLEVPPLSQRLDDLPLLARHFCQQASRSLGRPIELTRDGLDTLLSHQWNGHVRELRQVILAAGTIAISNSVGALEVRRVLGCAGAGSDSTKSAQKEQLRQVLESVAGDIKAAALELGVHRVTVYRRLKRLGLTTNVVP